MPQIKTSETRFLVLKDGRWQYRMITETKKYDLYEKKFIKINSKESFHELSEFGVVKRLEFYVVFRETMQNVWGDEAPPTRLVLKKFIAEVPKIEKYKNDFLKRADNAIIVRSSLHQGAARILSITDKNFVSEDSKFKPKTFNDIEALRAFLKEHLDIKSKTYPDIHEAYGGNYRIVPYRVKQ